MTPRRSRALPFVAVAAIALAGCEAPGPAPVAVFDPSSALREELGGHAEYDHLTEPRLVLSEPATIIGTVVPVGPRVLLDGVPIRTPTPIRNGSYLATEENSAARTVFRGRTDRACEVGILDFHVGNIYAETRNCTQRMETPHAIVLAEPGGTAYEVSVFGTQTRITVFRGVLAVALRSGGLPGRNFGAGVEVVVTATGVGEPRPARSTADWRRRWRFVVDAGGNERVCSAFAQAAVVDYEESVRRGCRLVGIAWQADARMHFERCLRALDPVALAAQEEAIRRVQLAQCGTRSPEPPVADGGQREKSAFCTRYAQGATSDNDENVRRRCGFSGPGWNSNPRVHFDWCMSGDNARLAGREEETRRARLRACRPPVILSPTPGARPQSGPATTTVPAPDRATTTAPPPAQSIPVPPRTGTADGPVRPPTVAIPPDRAKIDACTRYARTAVAQNRQNQDKRCGFTGARWSSSERIHFDWCMAGSNLQNAAPSEERARSADLARCSQPAVIR